MSEQTEKAKEQCLILMIVLTAGLQIVSIMFSIKAMDYSREAHRLNMDTMNMDTIRILEGRK